MPEETLDAIKLRHAQLLEKHPEFRQYCPAILQYDQEFANFCRDDDILDMVEQVIGGDLILWLTHLFCKPATTGREVPWHQDGEYWPIEPAATCTVWVALDTVDKENGAMRVIPGSHKDGSYPHAIDLSPNLTLNQVADTAAFDEESARYIELAPGQVGYLVTRIKELGGVGVGETVTGAATPAQSGGSSPTSSAASWWLSGAA